jgi:hypothetical protein
MRFFSAAAPLLFASIASVVVVESFVVSRPSVFATRSQASSAEEDLELTRKVIMKYTPKEDVVKVTPRKIVAVPALEIETVALEDTTAPLFQQTPAVEDDRRSEGSIIGRRLTSIVRVPTLFLSRLRQAVRQRKE